MNWRSSLSEKLVWLPKLGIGYYPVEASPYDESYWERYQSYKHTPIGIKLNQARIDIVYRYYWQTIVDVGIGNAAFIEVIPNGKGTDINPAAIEWLTKNDKLWTPGDVEAMTFWDSLEHIHNPEPLLNHARRYVFVSCPIYQDRDHILRSKHFRPDEHCWYWTKDGLELFMSNFGFSLVEYSNVESRIGREDIGSFVFKRI